jgi:hypothetical protein
MKQLNEFNPLILSAEFAELLEKHVGGKLKVKLTKLELVPEFLGDKLTLSFLVSDESWGERNPEE